MNGQSPAASPPPPEAPRRRSLLARTPPVVLRKAALLVALCAAILDQATKYAVLNNMDLEDGGHRAVLPFFDIVRFWNRGISFGMFNRLAAPELQHSLLVLLTFAIIIALLYSLRRAERPLTIFALGLVIGGACGNLIDRLYYGAVADFLYFHLGQYDFPAFNAGDSCVCVGVGLLLLDGLLLRNDKSVSFADIGDGES